MIRHFTASGIVISDDGHVLLIKHRKLGRWMNPGGHIEPDEDPVQAVLREVAEETGVTCEIVNRPAFTHPAATTLPSPFVICVQDIDDPEAGPHQHIDMAYVLRPTSRRTAPRLEEVTGCAWIPIGDISDLDTPPELPALVRRAAEYARWVG